MKNKSDLMVMLKETAILTAITLLSGLLLGFVYELTKEPIRLQQEKSVQEACRAVFPEGENIRFDRLEVSPSRELQASLAENGVRIGDIYTAAADSGAAVGYVIETVSSEGYNGDIVLYVGITSDGALNAVSILDISETPGLGLQAEKVLLPQLCNKAVDQIIYTKTGSTKENEIDAISGATVTTKAVVNAVNGALKMAEELRGGSQNE